MNRKFLVAGVVGATLLLSACNGQLVIERVVTTTPDPNLMVVTVTPSNNQGNQDNQSATSAPTTAPLSTPIPAAATTSPAGVAAAPTSAPATVTVRVTPLPPATGSVINASATPIPPTPTLSPFPTETRQEIFIAHQSFEKGYMFWVQARKIVWVLIANPTNPNVGEWYVYQDTFDEAVDKDDESIIAPDGKFVPKRGFGKLWRQTPGLRDALGWGITPEFGLNTEYKYQPGGYLDSNNQYVPGPGTHFITMLYKETFALSEPDQAGVARWQRVN
jgi:hypothetical protein